MLADTVYWSNSVFSLFTMVLCQVFRLAPARALKGSSTLNIEDQTVLYTLQQRPLNEDAAGFSIYRVSLNGPLSI
jgi:hypothetical protein